MDSGGTIRLRHTTPRHTTPPMPTIKVNDWTKDQLEDIKDEEDHSSFDSVIKSLLKERERSPDE